MSCDPKIEQCSVDASEELTTTGLSVLWQMTIMYLMNCALMPFLGLMLLPFGLSIWNSSVWAAIWSLDLIAFAPSSVMNMVAIFFGDTNVTSIEGKTVIKVSKIDYVAAFLIEWGTSNASLVVWSVGGLSLFILWLLNFTDFAYVFLWLSYVAAGFGT